MGSFFREKCAKIREEGVPGGAQPPSFKRKLSSLFIRTFVSPIAELGFQSTLLVVVMENLSKRQWWVLHHVHAFYTEKRYGTQPAFAVHVVTQTVSPSILSSRAMNILVISTDHRVRLYLQARAAPLALGTTSTANLRTS